MIFKNYLKINNFFLLNNLIRLNNFKTFFRLNSIIFVKNGNVLILSNFFEIKYNWINTYEDGVNDINFNFIDYVNFISYKRNAIKSSKLHDIIKLKKSSSILKKKNDFKYLILNYVNFLKNNYEKEKNSKKINFHSYGLDTKNLDYSKKIKLFFKDNRLLLKDFFNIKYYRKFSFSKNIIKISNFNKFNMLYNLENNLVNVLMKSDFFLSEKDCVWYIRNSLISVNFKIINKTNYTIKVNDIINVCYTNYYFENYKNTFNNTLNNLYKINLKIWSLNKNRITNSKQKENYPLWIDDYKFFKKDVPLNIEVDYTTMSIIILDYNLDFNSITYYNIKFINLYLNRLYNWKYII